MKDFAIGAFIGFVLMVALKLVFIEIRLEKLEKTHVEHLK